MGGWEELFAYSHELDHVARFARRAGERENLFQKPPFAESYGGLAGQKPI